MKIAGIIAEYNPFHRGHEYHIRKTKELTGADRIVVVMSGDYVQRGECALLPKHLRAKAALSGGADLVLELPVYYSLSSAEDFARGAVALLNSLGCVDHLSFGCDDADMDALERAAEMLSKETPAFKRTLRDLQRTGLSFPLAREKAFATHYDPGLAPLLKKPNNILAIEYLKALRFFKSSITPTAVLRRFAGHDSTGISEGHASALLIRKMIKDSGRVAAIHELIPEYSYKVLKNAPGFLFPDDFSLLIHCRLMDKSQNGFEDIHAIPRHLSRHIMKSINDYISFDNYCDIIKSKNIAHSAISRGLMSLALDLKESKIKKCISQNYIGYINILGFRKESSDLLSEIKNYCSLPIIAKPSRAQAVLEEPFSSAFADDLRCSGIYGAHLLRKTGSPCRNPLTISPVIV